MRQTVLQMNKNKSLKRPFHSEGHIDTSLWHAPNDSSCVSRKTRKACRKSKCFTTFARRDLMVRGVGALARTEQKTLSRKNSKKGFCNFAK